MTATARRVTAQRLGERIALGGPRDELRELAETVDGMLDRLELAFSSQQRFIAHASHELRTPLAVIRAELETTLANPAADARELRRMGAVVDAALGRTELLISSLLTLARSEAPLERRVTVELSELSEAVLEEFSDDIEERSLRLQQELEPAWVSGDPTLLERVLVNLVQNGVRYNRDGGLLRVSIRAAGARARLEVTSDGELIPAHKVEALLEPFRTLERSRSRGLGGAGLGLAIVKATVAAHGGEVTLLPRSEGGLSVAVSLPRAAVSMNGQATARSAVAR